jgi:hypothetical protein
LKEVFINCPFICDFKNKKAKSENLKLRFLCAERVVDSQPEAGAPLAQNQGLSVQ